VTASDAVPGAGTAAGIPEPKGPAWTYALEHQSWYASADTAPQVVVHHETYQPTGGRDGCEWQFEIQWLDGWIRIEFDEFAECVRLERPDLLHAISELPCSATPEQVVSVLTGLGFVDTTDRQRPDSLQVPA
jgi:hypothetical protein